MGSRERRARQQAETRRKILDAAREMFVRVGYEGTTMRAIAERIEYTPTAIYHHFRNKEALFAEVCRADLLSLAAALERIGAVEDPVERLGRLCDAYVSFGLSHPMHYQLLFMTRRPKGEPHAETTDPVENTYGVLRDTCAAAIAAGRLRPEFTDPEELAQILWSAVHGLLALHIVKKGQHGEIEWRDPRGAAARLRETLIRGLLRDGSVAS